MVWKTKTVFEAVIWLPYKTFYNFETVTFLCDKQPMDVLKYHNAIGNNQVKMIQAFQKEQPVYNVNKQLVRKIT